MQPAPYGATHDKLTLKDPLCNGLGAFATLFPLCLLPSSNGSKQVPGKANVLRRFVEAMKGCNRAFA
jgi:hypothetical protein